MSFLKFMFRRGKQQTTENPVFPPTPPSAGVIVIDSVAQADRICQHCAHGHSEKDFDETRRKWVTATTCDKDGLNPRGTYCDPRAAGTVGFGDWPLDRWTGQPTCLSYPNVERPEAPCAFFKLGRKSFD